MFFEELRKIYDGLLCKARKCEEKGDSKTAERLRAQAEIIASGAFHVLKEALEMERDSERLGI